MRDRNELDAQQEASLAPFAVRASKSRGRLLDEGEAPYRGPFQRDRDRIIHCAAFRRLEYKTQVFVSVMEGDHYRNRLTHTMEVTQIARTIARAMGLNEDLVEVLGLAHDLGHGPFGHSGEDALDEMMRDHGGFDHNIQGLRIVDRVERRYPDFIGLNLSYETREGFTKNLSALERGALKFAATERPPLEVQLVEHADEIAYNTHDLEDGLVSGALREDAVREVALWMDTEKEVTGEHPILARDQSLRWRAVVRRLIAKLATDMIRASETRLRAHAIETLEEVRACPESLMVFSAEMTERKSELERFLFQHFYRSSKVSSHTLIWQARLKEVFKVYQNDPRLLPEDHRERTLSQGEPLERIICDYVAGMTDRFAERVWETYCRA